MNGGPWFIFMVFKMVAVFMAGVSSRPIWGDSTRPDYSEDRLWGAWGWTLFWIAFAVIMRIVQWSTV